MSPANSLLRERRVYIGPCSGSYTVGILYQKENAGEGAKKAEKNYEKILYGMGIISQ